MNEIQNNNQFDFLSDEQLLVLLDAQMEGKDFTLACHDAQIAALTDIQLTQLKTLWDTGLVFNSWRDTILPRESMLQAALEATPMLSNFSAAFPTLPQSQGTNETKTPFSLVDPYEVLLREKWKVAAPFAAFFLIVGITFAMKGVSSSHGTLAVSTTRPVSSEQREAETMAVTSSPLSALQGAPTAPPPLSDEIKNTGIQTETMSMAMSKSASFDTEAASEEKDVDDVTLALSGEADADTEFLAQIDEDMSLLALEDDTVDSLKKTYNEEDF